jgi:hypothetical protein
MPRSKMLADIDMHALGAGHERPYRSGDRSPMEEQSRVATLATGAVQAACT